MTVPTLECLAVLTLADGVRQLPDHLLREVGIATEAKLRRAIYRDEVRPALNRLVRSLDRRFGSAYWSTTDELLRDLPAGDGDEWLRRSVGILTEHLAEVHEASLRTLTMEIVRERWHERRNGASSNTDDERWRDGASSASNTDDERWRDGASSTDDDPMRDEADDEEKEMERYA